MMIENLKSALNKANDPERLLNWYEKNLGLKADEQGSIVLSEERFHPVDINHFSPEHGKVLLNFQVERLAPALSTLADNGVRIEDRIQEDENGRFAWVFDPEGNRIEIWEPNPLTYNPIDLGEPE